MKSRYIVALILSAAVIAAGLGACTTSQVQQATVTVKAISADVTTACGAAAPLVSAVQNQANGGAAQTASAAVQALAAGCTINGQVQMTLNDAAPVTATNSGNSALWVATTALQVAAAVVAANP